MVVQLAQLAQLACITTNPTRRDDVRKYVFQSKLQTAFRDCSPGEVSRSSETRFQVAACDQIAIYRCPALATVDNPVCTLEAIDAAAVHKRQLAGPPASVVAATPTAEQLAEADRLFGDGRALAKASHHPEACAYFVRSDAIKRTFGTAVNLGDCAERDGHPGRAWQLFDEAARIADRDRAPARAQFARDRAAALAPLLCTVIVTIAQPAIPGLKIHIGERDIPPAREIRTLIEPGGFEVVIAATNVPERRRTFQGAAGSVVSVVLLDGLMPSVRAASP
jgi:hypothetical protein